MIRGDIAAVGIAYATEGPEGPLYADFHAALRHSFLTLGGRSGIDLRTLQELAGHSKPELTARYAHRRLYDLTGAVGNCRTLYPQKHLKRTCAHRTHPTLSEKTTSMPIRAQCRVQ